MRSNQLSYRAIHPAFVQGGGKYRKRLSMMERLEVWK
jgi:hypothetical protein